MSLWNFFPKKFKKFFCCEVIFVDMQVVFFFSVHVVVHSSRFYDRPTFVTFLHFMCTVWTLSSFQTFCKGALCDVIQTARSPLAQRRFSKLSVSVSLRKVFVSGKLFPCPSCCNERKRLNTVVFLFLAPHDPSRKNTDR